MENIKFKIKSVQKTINYGDENQSINVVDTRYILVDEKTGDTIDDAQGYGYKSFEKAQKAGWFKFKGGKQKIQTTENNAKMFWKQHKEAKNDICELYETWCKEIYRGEVTEEQIVNEIGIKYNISIPLEFLRYC